MRRTKWDAPSPLTSSTSSVSNMSKSPAASSADIEMVKALAKRRLDELMAKKLGSCSTDSTVSASSSFESNGISTSTASEIGGTMLSEVTSCGSSQNVISDSVQKAAAIAAALQNGKIPPNQSPLSSTTSPFYQHYGANMTMQYSQQYSSSPGKSSTHISSDKMSDNSSPAGMNSNATCYNYTAGPYASSYKPGFSPNAMAYRIPLSGNVYQQMANGMMPNVVGQSYTAVPPPYMQGSSSTISAGMYGNNSHIALNKQLTSTDVYSPYLMYNKVVDSSISTSANNKDAEKANDDNRNKKVLNKSECDGSASVISEFEEDKPDNKVSRLKQIFDLSLEEEQDVEFNHEIEQSANGMCTTDIDINFSKARTRLVRKEALQVIRLRTGAAVISRGKLKDCQSSNEKGLHIRITADTEEKVKDAVLIIEKLMVENVERVNISPELLADSSFDCVALLKGESDENLEYIMKISKAFVEVRGKGSKHPEDANKSDSDLLHVAIYGLTESSRLKGLSMAQKLVEFVTKEWKEKLRRFTACSQDATYNHQQHMIISSPNQAFQPYSVPPSSLSPYRYMQNTNLQNAAMYHANVNISNAMIGGVHNNMMQAPSLPGKMMNAASLHYSSTVLSNQPQIVSRPITPPIASGPPYGLSWQDLLTDEKEQARRRKEMEEKRKQREKERKERKGRKRRSRSRSESRSRSRSRSADEKKSSKNVKNFNFVPPPTELYASVEPTNCSVNSSSSICTSRGDDSDNDLTNEQIIKDQNLINEKYASASPPKEVNPSTIKNETVLPNKVRDSFVKDKDREIMPPPPPINFIKKKSVNNSSNVVSTVAPEDNMLNGDSSSCLSTGISNSEENVTSQSVSLVAYEDDSEEE